MLQEKVYPFILLLFLKTKENVKAPGVIEKHWRRYIWYILSDYKKTMLKSVVMTPSHYTFFNESFNIGSLHLPNRLIQGPLAGFSSAPFRQLYYQFLPPAYCVSEMISAHDVLYKHPIDSRYLYRAPEEKRLCYQISGHDPLVMAQAACRLEALGADLIDLNCGCPKPKIRKKGAGSALLEKPARLCEIVSVVREAISIPLTVKLRIQGGSTDMTLAQSLEDAGADALIIHGRRWTDDYDIPVDFHQIRRMKDCVKIPVIANGDIIDEASLIHASKVSGADAYMIARAGSGNPWIYQNLLEECVIKPSFLEQINLFMTHLQGLASLESEHQAVLQSKSLVRYYFGKVLSEKQVKYFYGLADLESIEYFLVDFL